jgi:hypothetical protein
VVVFGAAQNKSATPDKYSRGRGRPLVRLLVLLADTALQSPTERRRGGGEKDVPSPLVDAVESLYGAQRRWGGVVWRLNECLRVGEACLKFWGTSKFALVRAATADRLLSQIWWWIFAQGKIPNQNMNTKGWFSVELTRKWF